MAYDYHAVRAAMHARFPAVFTARGAAPRPLMVGVDIAAAVGDAIPAKDLQHFLRSWTKRPEYQAALAAGGARYDLDGQVVGSVTPEESAAAAERLAAIPAESLVPGNYRRRKNRKRAASRRAQIDKLKLAGLPLPPRAAKRKDCLRRLKQRQKARKAAVK